MKTQPASVKEKRHSPCSTGRKRGESITESFRKGVIALCNREGGVTEVGRANPEWGTLNKISDVKLDLPRRLSVLPVTVLNHQAVSQCDRSYLPKNPQRVIIPLPLLKSQRFGFQLDCCAWDELLTNTIYSSKGNSERFLGLGLVCTSRVYFKLMDFKIIITIPRF